MTVIIDKTYTSGYRKWIREFPLQEIRTKAQAARATEILDELFTEEDHADPGVEQYVRVLANLLGNYEDKSGEPIARATPLEVLRELMTQNDMSQTDLAATLGQSQPTVSLIFSGRRSITIEQAKKLAEIFAVPASLFLGI
jgi:antitoxin component HigA of HigAB toxin-antitoxin module